MSSLHSAISFTPASFSSPHPPSSSSSSSLIYSPCIFCFKSPEIMAGGGGWGEGRRDRQELEECLKVFCCLIMPLNYISILLQVLLVVLRDKNPGAINNNNNNKFFHCLWTLMLAGHKRRGKKDVIFPHQARLKQWKIIYFFVLSISNTRIFRTWESQIKTPCK